MKNILTPKLLPVFPLTAGILGLALRLWLFGTGMDEKGLLVASHPANVLLFILTAIVMVALYLCVSPLAPVSRYCQLFPASPLRAAGCLAAAAGILLTNIGEIAQQQDTLTFLVLVLGILASVSFVLLALCRFKGAKPNFLLHTIVTVYLMFHLVAQYRHWSPEPQLQTYFFQLLACVFLMCCAYHATTLDVKKGSRRWYVFCSQAALFFCLLSIRDENWLFYLTMALWTATNLCALQTKKPRYIKQEED